jgi:hypothetical protein
LCEVALVVAIFKVIHILGDLPWHKVVDVKKEWPTQITGGSALSTRKEESRGRSVPKVGELPPEVVAPILKGAVKSAGFGSSTGDSNSDTQLHEGNSGSAGSQSSQPASDGDETPDTDSADSAKSDS